MKIKFLTLFLFLALFAKAQTVDTASWSPAGATWVYGVPAMSARQYLKLIYEADTVIQGINVKKINVYFFDYIGDLNTQIRGGEIYLHTDYAYESNDTIYMLVRDTFRVQYVFSAQAGDSWQITETGHYQQFGTTLPPTDTVAVRSLATYPIAGLTQMNMGVGSSWGVGAMVFKNIGSYHNPYPLPNNGPITGFFYADWMECYYDEVRGYIDFDAWRTCRELVLPYDSVVAVSETVDLSPSVNIYPNPSHSEVFIDIQADYQLSNQLYVRVLNSLGQLHIEQKINPQQQLNISKLPAGTYIFVVSDGKTFSKPVKIIKL